MFSGFFSAFIASFFWMAAMTKFELSYAYPFMSASFVLVFLISVILFQESITMYKVIGLGLIIIGIFVSSRGL
ncbi:EamA family transporter [Candidatus Venteria ishoeyi]